MVINGDCVEELKKIEDSSVDLILIDPPYFISRDSNFKKISTTTTDKMSTKYNISLDFGEWDKGDLDWNYLFYEYNRILKKSGTLIIFYDVWKSNELKEIASSYKLKQPRVCAWIKTNPVPINSKVNYLSNATEYFFTFVKGGKPTFHSEYDKGFYQFPICHGKERYQHPTQKPLDLILEIVKKHSNEGDVVLDSFAGTGTTGHACLLSNRKFILIERDVEYFDIIQKRLNKIEVQ
jgi:site-specific DNA-methyltransferase (adenine-specific)